MVVGCTANNYGSTARHRVHVSGAYRRPHGNAGRKAAAIVMVMVVVIPLVINEILTILAGIVAVILAIFACIVTVFLAVFTSLITVTLVPVTTVAGLFPPGFLSWCSLARCSLACCLAGRLAGSLPR